MEKPSNNVSEKLYLDIYGAIAHGLAGFDDIGKEDCELVTENVIRVIDEHCLIENQEHLKEKL